MSSPSPWQNPYDDGDEGAESPSNASTPSSIVEYLLNDLPETQERTIPYRRPGKFNPWSPEAQERNYTVSSSGDAWTADDERSHQDALERLRLDLEGQSGKQNANLDDLGLRFPAPTARGELADHTKLESVVKSGDSAIRPRPHLWQNVIPDDASSEKDPKGSWPARLLHVPKMTSVEWSHGNYYRDEREPAYAIISYTWGRWEIRGEAALQSPALHVDGITWKVPPVRDVLFSVADFQNVLATVAAEARTNWVWVDIACIDQTIGSEQKRQEIGRQAKIFENASQAFIWLVEERKYVETGEEEDLPREARLDYLLREIEFVSRLAFEPHRNWFLDQLTMPASGTDDEQQAVGETESHTEDDSWMVNAARSISYLTSIPWFTSLWCLQEAFLKPSAIFLDRQGNAVTKEVEVVGDADQPYMLSDVLASCKQLHQLFAAVRNPLSRRKDERDLTVLKGGLVSVIERSGLEALADRDRLTLYSCARLRHAQDETDRVKGIMQVWGFQLGDSAPGDPDGRTGTLAELENELGVALLRDYPIESQIQVHLSTVAGRQSWRISDRSSTPAHTLSLTISGHIAGTVDRQTSQLGLRRANDILYAHFGGRVCSFEVLRQAWAYVAEHDYVGVKKAPQHHSSPVRISLDQNVVLNSVTLQASHSLQNVPENRQLELACSISNKIRDLGRDLNVLLLGIVSQQSSYSEGQRCKGIGIIVMNAPDDTVGQWQKRLGICIWDVYSVDGPEAAEYRSALDLLAGNSVEWQLGECIFG